MESSVWVRYGGTRCLPSISNMEVGGSGVQVLRCRKVEANLGYMDFCLVVNRVDQGGTRSVSRQIRCEIFLHQCPLEAVFLSGGAMKSTQKPLLQRKREIKRGSVARHGSCVAECRLKQSYLG